MNGPQSEYEPPLTCVICRAALQGGTMVCTVCDAEAAASARLDATPGLITWLRHQQKERFIRQKFTPGDDEYYDEAFSRRLRGEVTGMLVSVVAVVGIALLLAGFRACGG